MAGAPIVHNGTGAEWKEKMMRARTGLLAIGGAIVLTVGGGTAYATIAASPVSSGVITGCYTNAEINGSHVFVLQDAGTSCPTGSTAISWNQTGPAGSQGPQGIQGPPGPAGVSGATGPAGASVLTSPAFPPNPCISGNTDIDLANGDVYSCSASVWSPTGSSLQGPPGTNGTNGTNGNTVLNGTGPPSSTVGNNGDFYVDTAADVLYGPKSGGAWPMPGTSLIGPAGAAGPTGAAGAMGPQGVAGPQGPPGPAGTSSIDALDGTVCNTASSNAGTLNVSYGSNGSVTITCTPTTLYTLSVSIATGDGNDTVVSNPAGIDCNPSAADSVCSAEFPAGYSVTLTAEPDTDSVAGNLDVLAGWGDQSGCVVRVNEPGLERGTPAITTCTVTMSSDQSVSASFSGQMGVQLDTNYTVDLGIHVNGIDQPSQPPSISGVFTYVVPYGDVMEIESPPADTATFNGAACNASADPSAVVTSDSCEFTMFPGADSLGGSYGNPGPANGTEVVIPAS